MNHFLLMLCLASPAVAGAGDTVTGEINKAFDGRARYCQSIKDTQIPSPAIILQAPEMDATDADFSLTITYRKVKCVESDGSYRWEDVPVGAGYEYDAKVGGQMRHIRVWSEDLEAVWTSRKSDLLGTIPLKSDALHSHLKFTAGLDAVIGQDGRDRLARTGKTEFRVNLFERGVAKYTMDGGKTEIIGLTGSGVFILKGKIEKSANGYRVSLIGE